MTYPRYDDVYFEAMRAMDDYNPPLPPGPVRHTTAADQQAFDKLWNERQEITEIVRQVRDSTIGHKQGITDIEAILERVS